MSAVVSLIGILIAFVFINYAVYRGLGVPIACIIGSLVIWITSGINIEEGWADAMTSVTSLVGTVIPMFIFGSILGFLFVESGAAASLCLALFRPFKNAQNPRVKQIGTLFMFFLARILLGLSGINSMALIPIMVAFVTVLFIELDIPRRYCNAVLMVAGSLEAFLPAVPTMLNVLLPQFLPGFTATTRWFARIVLLVIFLVGSVVWLNLMISRDKAKGEHFVKAGNLDVGDLEDPDVKRPFWLVTLIPIVFTFAVYNFAGLEAWSSVALGTVVAFILFVPYIKIPEGQTRLGYLVDRCNKSAITLPLYYCLSYMPAAAMMATSGYTLLLSLADTLAATIPLPIALAICAMIIVTVGESGLMISCNFATSIFIPAGMAVGTAGLLIVSGNAVFDSLPNNNGIVIQADLTETSMKECYPPIFKTTVLLTFAMLVLVVIGATLGII